MHLGDAEDLGDLGLGLVVDEAQSEDRAFTLGQGPHQVLDDRADLYSSDVGIQLPEDAGQGAAVVALVPAFVQ